MRKKLDYAEQAKLHGFVGSLFECVRKKRVSKEPKQERVAQRPPKSSGNSRCQRE